MDEFLRFTLDFIRANGWQFSWMERERLELSALLASRLRLILNSHSFIVLSDHDRAWFAQYFVHNINKEKLKPRLPIYGAEIIKTPLECKEDYLLLHDMLSLSFPNGYSYIYFGKGSDKSAVLAKGQNESLLFLMDESMDNSFYLNSQDELLDFKLISLFKLIQASLDAIIYSKVRL